MTDDIVTRLRKQMSNEFVIDHPNMVRVPTLYEQAADEIERLRTSGKELLDAFTEMAEKGMLPKITIRLSDAGQTFEQAVRGG